MLAKDPRKSSKYIHGYTLALNERKLRCLMIMSLANIEIA